MSIAAADARCKVPSPPPAIRNSKGPSAKALAAATAALGGTVALAAPTNMVLNDSFTLQTSNQGMFGTGTNGGWTYDSGFQGVQWGSYINEAPKSVNLGGVVGSERTVIIPSFCAWSPWGSVCTPEFAADTRTGAEVTLESSGKDGVQVAAAAKDGRISAVVPLRASVTIAQTDPNKFHISGTGGMDLSKPGANITASAPSFTASVKAFADANIGMSALGCFIFAGCSSKAGSLRADFEPTILAVDMSKDKPINLFGLKDFGLPGVNKWLEVRDKPDKTYEVTIGDSTTSAFSPKGVLVAAIKVERPSGASGGEASNGGVSLSTRADILHVDADITGILQKALNAPFDILNPKIGIEIENTGEEVSVAGTAIDFQAGVKLGLAQEFSFTPKLAVTLNFDKPIVEYVQELDHMEARDLGETRYLLFGGVPKVGYSPQDQNTWTEASDADVLNPNILFNRVCGRAVINWLSAGNSEDYAHHCSGRWINLDLSQDLGSQNFFAYDRSRPRMLGPNEALDHTYAGVQCKEDPVPPQWNGEPPPSWAHSGIWTCVEGSTEAVAPITGYFPVYKPNMQVVERGTSVTVDLDKETDFGFLGDAGKLVSWTYSMTDQNLFRSTAAIDFGTEARIKAGCFTIKVPLTSGWNDCLYSKELGDWSSGLIDLPSARVFDQTFALAGFDTATFSVKDGGPDGGGAVPEPGTLALAAAALAGLAGVASGRRRRRELRAAS